jgi:integrase/recombinase XerD
MSERSTAARSLVESRHNSESDTTTLRGTPMGTTLITTPTTTLTTPAPAPVTALVARGTQAGAPAYVTAEQARSVIDAATRTRDRLLLECLWQTGGRVSEVCRLHRSDIDPAEGALVLENLKQRRRAMQRKLVYVSPSLIGALLAFCKDAHIPPTGYVFSTLRNGETHPISRQMCWKLVTGSATAVGVRVVDTTTGQERPATGLDFRHGAAVHQLRSGVPLSEVSQQLGHARIDTTMAYTRLTNAERRRYADRVTW